MQIENREEYREIPISSLGLSPRTSNTLMRAKINTLYLLIENRENLSRIRNMGAKSKNEIFGIMEMIIKNGVSSVLKDKEQEETVQDDFLYDIMSYSLPDELLDRPAQDLHISVRISNSFVAENIKTIRDVLTLRKADILHLKNLGEKSVKQLVAEIELLKSLGEDYFNQLQEDATVDTSDSSNMASRGKGFDYNVIDVLKDQFFMRSGYLADWYGISRQRIYDLLQKRPPKRRDVWTGKEMIESEKNILVSLVQEKKFNYSDDTVICSCMNNRKNDLACLFIYEQEIKCFFLKDLDKNLQEMVISTNYHRYMEQELSGGIEGHIVYVLKKPYFLPDQPDRFRANAQLRGISMDEYARFVSGCPLGDSRSVTDDQIISFFEKNMVEGKVYISSEPKNQWIRSLASRNGYYIKDFIEFFGYESLFDGTELTRDGARERHIELLKRYIVNDNDVYFPTNANIYRILTTYCYNKDTNINEYIRSLGFGRLLEKPEVKRDTEEKDMCVHEFLPEATFEEKVFAQYPLIGSKIIDPEMLERLNQNTRRHIDTVLRFPSTQLSTRDEMEITLALINNAKNWKNEENPNFWNYITLQFGYRDASGAVVKLLQSSLENAMKKNCRLFIEDTNGRAFKSTAVVHALSTRKSWITLFDFLFDFYKNNLDWKVIPGDPILELMVSALQRKLEGENYEDAELTELTISSYVYSFQEGIRKLILFRPIFTKKLFEKLLGKIDALVNSEDIPVKTYEEQLCEEWFKEKITTIANTKRTVRKRNNVQSEVAIDYSRIRAKYILINENSVHIVLPDIRLKRENIQLAELVIFYNDSVTLRQRLNWYGNELGKTLSSVSVALPAYVGKPEEMNIRLQIFCDDEIIFDSEDTMNRRVMIFSATSEVNITQIHRDNYTIVMPTDCHLDVENVDITQIESFKISGLKAYFLELHDGYVLTVDGNLLAFDSESVADVRVISPSECLSLPRVTTPDAECYLARRGSSCTIIFGNTDYRQQFVVMKNGKKIEFSELEDTGDGQTFTCLLSGENDFCRLQVINLGNEKLVFDRSFMLVSETDFAFDREFYFATVDYKDALFYVEIDDYYEEATFTAEDEEVRLPFRNGELHVDIPKIRIQETTGEWLNGMASAWYVGDIPQNSLLKVSNPPGISTSFLVGGKDIMYDGQGFVTIVNVIQSYVGSDDMEIAQLEMLIMGNNQKQCYILTTVCYKECFLSKPEFWYGNGKLFWNQGGTFIGRANRIFTLKLSGMNDVSYEFELNVDTESIDLPEDMPIGNYRFEISILVGSLFKKVKEILAEGDCVIGDQNLLRFNGRKIVLETLTDENNEDAGHITIRTCYIDQLEFMGVEDTSEGICPVYRGVLYTEGRHGERYEFSFDENTNNKGINKMMVNPVRIVYVGDNALCITDSDRDGLYYYHYYDKYLDKVVYALTDHKYTKVNRHKYSNADLYSYRTERI